MTIYLYIKTHNKTGLKYLGKTSAKDPYRYYGSGTYWKAHLRKHGYDFSTIILKECKTNTEVKYWGEHYSNLWNVVESKEWANLKPETGEGGAMSYVWNKGVSMGHHWTNGKEFVVQRQCPGEGWVRGSPTKGRSYQHKSSEAKTQSGHKGIPWWNNGIKCKRSIEQPGPEWVRGFLSSSTGSKGMTWWNNGILSKMSFHSPGPEWTKGRVKL